MMNRDKVTLAVHYFQSNHPDATAGEIADALIAVVQPMIENDLRAKITADIESIHIEAVYPLYGMPGRTITVPMPAEWVRHTAAAMAQGTYEHPIAFATQNGVTP